MQHKIVDQGDSNYPLPYRLREEIMKLCNVVMVTSITADDTSNEDDDLIYVGEYPDIARTSKTDYMKSLRVRRLHQ